MGLKERQLGVVRGLASCASPSGRFTLLAIDHRQNLVKSLTQAGIEATSRSMIEFKLSVVRSLARRATGVLLDPEFGARQAVAEGALPGATGLVIALEATGYFGDPTSRRNRLLPGWSVVQARQMGASAAKLLVYYHPEAPAAADQEALIRSVAESCRHEGLPLFLEPLTYPIDDAPMSAATRADLIVETARRLTRIGGDILKAEFPGDAASTDVDAWRRACARLDEASRVPWVVLSGAAEPAVFGAQVEIACRAGASGVAVGRSVWGDAVGAGPGAWSTVLAKAPVARFAAIRRTVDRLARPWTTHPGRPTRVAEAPDASRVRSSRTRR